MLEHPMATPLKPAGGNSVSSESQTFANTHCGLAVPTKQVEQNGMPKDTWREFL
jgi:hypothetical protein